MREILFRGKRINNGEWVEGDLIQLHDGRKYIVNNVHGACFDEKGNFVNTEEPFVCHVDPATVGQYTGLTDKNGKKIFERDILYNPSWWWGPRFVYLMQGECGTCHGESVMQYILAKNVDNPERNATWNLWDGCQVEVIGNIHDNPELLKEA